MNPVFGKDKILKFRLFSDQKVKEAARLALQVEHTISYDGNLDTVKTKDGQIGYSGGLGTEIEINAIISRDEVNTMLRDAVVKDQLLEVWEIDLGATPVEGKYPALYGRGRLGEWEDPSNVEELSQFSTTMAVDGYLVSGMATVTPEELEQVQYAFEDTTKKAAG